MSLERYNEQEQSLQRQPIVGPVERAIAQARESTGQEPVIIVVNNDVPQQIQHTNYDTRQIPDPQPNMSGLIFVLFLGLIAVALIAMIIVSCHATPIVQHTTNIPNCHFLC